MFDKIAIIRFKIKIVKMMTVKKIYMIPAFFKIIYSFSSMESNKLNSKLPMLASSTVTREVNNDPNSSQ